MAELARQWTETAYGPPEGRWTGLAHWTHPLQQRVRSRTHLFQLAFAREAAGRIGESAGDCVLEPRRDGLLVLGRHEALLRAPIRQIVELYHRRVDVDAPRVRHCPGEPPCEPVMALLVRTSRPLLPAVTRDLARRGARAVRTRLEQGCILVHAQARLSDLLGYQSMLERLSAGAAEVCMRLSHYEPMAFSPDPHAA